MTQDEILFKLQDVFRTIFEDDTLVPSPDMTAADVERWDSLSHIDMMMMVESEFRVRFSTREITSLKNVGELVAIIRAKAG